MKKYKYRHELKFKIYVAHVNHMIRKEAISEEKTLKQGLKVVYTPYCQFRRIR